VFLRLLGIVHLTAFASYAVQIISLNGAHGVLPTCNFLEQIARNVGEERFLFFPTVEWISSSDASLVAIAVGGTILSLLIMAGVATAPALIINAVLWLSIVTGGGEFTEFQSDGMLIEATVLSLFVAPWCLFEAPWPVRLGGAISAPSPMGIWLLRFFIFRFMFASGAVKLLSGDPTWANLTALQYHFETQPLPTPLAWYIQQLPAVVLKGMAVMMFVSELVAPLLIFGPRLARLTAFILICGLQFMIEGTGNYTFLNLLTVVIAVAILDDGLISRVLPRSLSSPILANNDAKVQWKWRRCLVNGAASLLFILAGSQLLSTLLGPYVVPRPIRACLIYLSPYHLADRYGLFAVMTTDRPEIVFQGSNDGKNWLPYVFSNKVDDLHDAPPWVAPHMPRLPWRLWFAAMTPARDNPWVLDLGKRVLEGSVDSFFARNPFADKPPRFLRALVYDYHFTDFKQRSQTGNWWWRDHERQFFPPVELRNGQLELAQP
jgi:hypothetical protein